MVQCGLTGEENKKLQRKGNPRNNDQCPKAFESRNKLCEETLLNQGGTWGPPVRSWGMNLWEDSEERNVTISWEEAAVWQPPITVATKKNN